MKTHSQEVSAADFEQDVIEASKLVPVVVDFWAPWCAPCRALKPILEKLAAEYKGKFRLAKVNTDENPELANRLGVRSIPDVKAFLGGAVVAQFSGALPESTVRAFIEKVVPGPVDKLRFAAKKALGEGDFETAESRLQEALKLEAGHREARLDLVELLVARQAFSEADLALQILPERERDDRAEQLAGRIEFWKKVQSLPGAAELAGAVARDPANPELRLRLAERRMADREYELALEQLIEVVRKDRGALREQARKAMLEIFDLAADQTELVQRFRRQLSSALY